MAYPYFPGQQGFPAVQKKAFENQAYKHEAGVDSKKQTKTG